MVVKYYNDEKLAVLPVPLTAMNQWYWYQWYVFTFWYIGLYIQHLFVDQYSTHQI